MRPGERANADQCAARRRETDPASGNRRTANRRASGHHGGSPAHRGRRSGSFDGTILFGAPISLTGSLAKEGGLTRDGYDIWKDTYNEAGGIKVGGKRTRSRPSTTTTRATRRRARRWPRS